MVHRKQFQTEWICWEGEKVGTPQARSVGGGDSPKFEELPTGGGGAISAMPIYNRKHCMYVGFSILRDDGSVVEEFVFSHTLFFFIYEEALGLGQPCSRDISFWMTYKQTDSGQQYEVEVRKCENWHGLSSHVSNQCSPSLPTNKNWGSGG